jgi:hypothetical protein
MRYPVLIALVSLAGSAAAQPADPPPVDPVDSRRLVEAHPCTVTIVRAPDDVRREIEDWVHREVSCRISLDVRVIPTDGGLYLMARESTGKLHERLVPDGQAAGVLVASWVANDSLEPLPPPAPPVPALPVLIPAVPLVAPPGELMLRGAPSRCTTLACRSPRRTPTWGFGVTVMPRENSGARVRLDFDLLRSGGFAAGLVLAGASAMGERMEDVYYYYSFAPRGHRVDGRALGGLSWTMYHGAWSARVQAAAGGVWSHVFKDEDEGVFAKNWAGLAFEASILFGYHVSDAWSVGVAPVATMYSNSAWRNDPEASLGGGDFGLLLELRRGP